jgi:acetyltransferase-like isoleucine patch superfamily enzyme
MRDRVKSIFRIRLAKSIFTELDAPQRVDAWLGARRFAYSEQHWLGNPGHYQTYVFAVNDAGVVIGELGRLLNRLMESERIQSPERTWQFDPGDDRIQTMHALMNFRKGVRINTYVVVGPNVTPDQVPLGPDADVIRTLL